MKRVVIIDDLILLAPARMEDAQAAKILHNARSVKLLLPGFDEDGRVAFWKDAAENASRQDVITIQKLAEVGTEVVWAWQSVIDACRD